MRFTIDHSVLAPALTTVSRAVPSRTVRPILSSILFEARGGRLTLTATDLETAVVAEVAASIDQDGRLAIPSRYLSEMTRRIPGGTVELATHGEGSSARISWGRTQFTIHGHNAADYPHIPAFPDRPDRTLSQPQLRRAITHTAFAAAQGETARALLTGVELRFADGALFALATDGFHAAAYATDDSVDRPEESAIVVPAAVLQNLARLLSDVEAPCDIALQGNHVLFRAGGTYLSARLLEGKYFAVLDLIPKVFPATVRVSKDALLGASERVAVISENEPPYAVTVEVTDGLLRLSASSADVGTAEESIEAAVSGPAMRMGFNVRQLLEGIRRFEGSEVLVEISGQTTLARMTDPDDQRLRYLQMPLQMPE